MQFEYLESWNPVSLEIIWIHDSVCIILMIDSQKAFISQQALIHHFGIKVICIFQGIWIIDEWSFQQNTLFEMDMFSEVVWCHYLSNKNTWCIHSSMSDKVESWSESKSGWFKGGTPKELLCTVEWLYIFLLICLTLSSLTSLSRLTIKIHWCSVRGIHWWPLDFPTEAFKESQESFSCHVIIICCLLPLLPHFFHLILIYGL